MEVKDREPVTRVQPPERAVFVTDDDRRARRLRRGAILAALSACLWIVGLGVGMLGFGSLPGIPFVNGDQKSSDRSEGERPQPVARQDLAPARQSQSSRAESALARRRTGRSGNAGRPASRPAGRPAGVGTTVSAPAQGPVNPAGRQRGWTRKGLPAPPGQLRKTAPPPPPGARGRRRGQTNTTTTTVPVPPGQAKKTPPPPPEG
jgi:hypothetical protein